MQVKKFEGFSMKEALKSLKAEFGNDAVILSTGEKLVDDSTKVYEVTAAAANSKQHGASRHGISDVESIDSKFDLLDLKFSTMNESVAKKTQLQYVESGLEELKALLLEALKEKNDSTFKDLPKAMVPTIQQLKLMGVDQTYIFKLLDYLKNLPVPGDKKADALQDHYRSHAIRWMLKRVKIAPKAGAQGGSKRIHVFFGPTGSGKTSLVAKIASHYATKEKNKVILIGCSFDKVGANENLKLLAKILNVKLLEATDLTDLALLLEKVDDKSLVLVDVAGRSPKSIDKLKELEGIRELPYSVNTHLVLSITEKEQQLDRSIRNFSQAGINNLAFTKLDESWSYGEIFNLSLKWSVPLSFFSTGQNIPGDFERASKERVVERIFGI